MPTSRHRDYADGETVDSAARLYAAALWAEADAKARVEEARRTLLAAVERER